jgi:hypothetical protein
MKAASCGSGAGSIERGPTMGRVVIVLAQGVADWGYALVAAFALKAVLLPLVSG